MIEPPLLLDRSYKTECPYDFSNDGRRPPIACVDTLRSRVDQIERVLEVLRSGSTDEVTTPLKKLRIEEDVGEIVGGLQEKERNEALHKPTIVYRQAIMAPTDRQIPIWNNYWLGKERTALQSSRTNSPKS